MSKLLILAKSKSLSCATGILLQAATDESGEGVLTDQLLADKGETTFCWTYVSEVEWGSEQRNSRKPPLAP